MKTFENFEGFTLLLWLKYTGDCMINLRLPSMSTVTRNNKLGAAGLLAAVQVAAQGIAPKAAEAWTVGTCRISGNRTVRCAALNGRREIGFITGTTDGEVTAIKVSDDFQRSGIGTGLLGAFEQVARSYGTRNFRAHSTRRAVGFYQHNGYTCNQSLYCTK